LLHVGKTQVENHSVPQTIKAIARCHYPGTIQDGRSRPEFSSLTQRDGEIVQHGG